MKLGNNLRAFLLLVKAGLWEQEARLSQFSNVNYEEVMHIAEEQAVVGLVTSGLEHVLDVKVPQADLLQFIGQSLQLEQQNTAMNGFIEFIVEKMRKEGIYNLLVKGQGVAQSYEKPLWRSYGDIDFLLSEDNYNKAKTYLTSLATIVNDEDERAKHLGMTIDTWVVELHGSLRSGLWKRLDHSIDAVQDDIFYGGNVRSWQNGTTQVFLPRADEDVFLVFAHILQHFFQEGIGLRQICDWCRLLWTYRETINTSLLEKRIKSAGIMTEWKAFAYLAVDTLGMPVEAMPFYTDSYEWKRRASHILAFIFETGNFGHNRDYSYYNKYPLVIYKVISLWKHTKDFFRYLIIFPVDSMKVYSNMIYRGIRVAMQGK